MSSDRSDRTTAALAALMLGVAGCVAGTDDGGTTPVATASGSVTGKFASAEFASPVTMSVPAGWIAYETKEAVVLSAPAESGPIGERLVLFRTTGGAIEVEVLAGFETSGREEGRPIPQPWPDDFGAWLAEIEMFEVLDESEATVGGSTATIFHARSDFEPPSGNEELMSLGIILVGAPGQATNVTVRAEEMFWRFILFEDRDLAIAYGALAEEFSEERVRSVVDSLTFDQRPSGSWNSD